MNPDYIGMAIDEAIQAFGGQSPGVFNAAGFSNALAKMACLDSALDGNYVRVILSGRENVVRLDPDGSHYQKVPPLDPCPFCEETAKVVSGRVSGWAIECPRCGTATQDFSHLEQACTLWNGAKTRVDKPEMDATDGAHPAWWRGHDYVSKRILETVVKSANLPKDYTWHMVFDWLAKVKAYLDLC